MQRSSLLLLLSSTSSRREKALLPSAAGLGFQCGRPQCCPSAPPWVLLRRCAAKPGRRSPLPGSCRCQRRHPDCRRLRARERARVRASVRARAAAAAAAGPAVEGWVAHDCRLPDAEACSVLGAWSISLSLSLSLSLALLTPARTHTHARSHTACSLHCSPEREKEGGGRGGGREWAEMGRDGKERRQ